VFLSKRLLFLSTTRIHVCLLLGEATCSIYVPGFPFTHKTTTSFTFVVHKLSCNLEEKETVTCVISPLRPIPFSVSLSTHPLEAERKRRGTKIYLRIKYQHNFV